MRLSLSRAGARGIVEVADDGRGLSPSSGAGLGLGNMRAREAALGGELLVGPAENGHGTTIRLAVPL